MTSFNLITSPKLHLQIPSYWRLGFQHMNLGERVTTQSIAVILGSKCLNKYGCLSLLPCYGKLGNINDLTSQRLSFLGTLGLWDKTNLLLENQPVLESSSLHLVYSETGFITSQCSLSLSCSRQRRLPIPLVQKWCSGLKGSWGQKPRLRVQTAWVESGPCRLPVVWWWGIYATYMCIPH